MPGIGGFSWDEIVQLAGLRTEQRGQSLDLSGELYIALQELCLERRWWWRRRVTVFNIVAGQALYDLTSSAAGAINAPDLQQIAKNGFKIFVPSTPQGGFVPGLFCDGGIPYVCPEPVFDADKQDVIIAMQSTYPPNVPCRFFLVPGQSATLQVDPIPNLTCPAALAYWAVPNYTDDSADLAVPLLPVWMQPLLIKKLEVQIERFSQSDEGPQKYTMVAGEYAKLLEKAALYRDFADGKVEDLRIRTHQDSVQSTR
jgi:hypothetical protein